MAAETTLGRLDRAQETLNLFLIVAGLGIAGLLLYELIQVGGNLGDAITAALQKIGIGGPTAQQQGANTVINQLQTVGGQPNGTGGYDKIGASGQMWTCTGGANDMCAPISVDANGVATVTGAAIPAAQAN